MADPPTTGPPLHAEFRRRRWPAEPSELSPIRSAVGRWLTSLGLTDDTAQDLVLATSEAASNAVEHAYQPATSGDVVELSLWTEPDVVCIEIKDHGSWRPPAPRSGTRGLGITLMHRLVQSVLIHYDPDGTRVLLRHPLRGPSGR